MVYLLCASKKFGNNINFVYIDLKNNQNCIIKYTEEKQKEYEKIISEICEQIKNIQPQEEIEHTKICEMCEYRKICK